MPILMFQPILQRVIKEIIHKNRKVHQGSQVGILRSLCRIGALVV